MEHPRRQQQQQQQHQQQQHQQLFWNPTPIGPIESLEILPDASPMLMLTWVAQIEPEHHDELKDLLRPFLAPDGGLAHLQLV
jgi:hypothetical protein